MTGKGEKIARVDEMRRSVQAHLNGIAHWFDDPKITLIVRANGDAMVFTNDNDKAAILAEVERNFADAAIEKREIN